MDYRPHPNAKNERNRAMIADYLGGMDRHVVAEQYGISFARFSDILQRQGVVLPPDERARRNRARYATRRKAPGRTPVWPDCPPELAEDYRLFRRKGLRAAEARAILDPGFQA